MSLKSSLYIVLNELVDDFELDNYWVGCQQFKLSSVNSTKGQSLRKEVSIKENYITYVNEKDEIEQEFYLTYYSNESEPSIIKFIEVFNYRIEDLFRYDIKTMNFVNSIKNCLPFDKLIVLSREIDDNWLGSGYKLFSKDIEDLKKNYKTY